uniref:Uncharacterized protein n=1 Tax=Glossina austeni TaxID=7395 RepID=A0A1A9US46_GLOAU
MYAVLCQTPLTYAEGCYDSYHILQADNLWLPMDSLAELNNLVSSWMLTLEEQGCHNLISAGSSGAIQAMLPSFGKNHQKVSSAARRMNVAVRHGLHIRLKQ